MFRKQHLSDALLAAALTLVLAAPASAQRDNEPRNTKKTVAMSQQVYEGLQATQELVEAGTYGQAHQELNKLLQKKKLSSYETAQIWNLSAYAYYNQERYADAIRSYENVMAQPDLPDALVQSTLKTMSQLYFTTENYQKALETVQRLMRIIDDPSPDIYMLVGQAHFQMKQYDQALGPIREGIAKYREQGKNPKENWLLLLRVIYYEKGDYAQMANVLRELIQYYPKDQYLLTLAGAYSEMGDTKKQLTLTEVLYDGGYLTQSHHIVNLANLYLMHETPYKAAKLLEKEIESGRVDGSERNLRLLSQAWYQAREDQRSIDPLRRAAQLSGDGELFVRLAQAHINLEQWSEAADAVQQGLSRGGVKRPDTANIMLGMALFNQKKLRSARDAFAAAASDQRSARTARQWIAHCESEIERAKTLDQVVPTTAPRERDAILDQIG